MTSTLALASYGVSCQAVSPTNGLGTKILQHESWYYRTALNFQGSKFSQIVTFDDSGEAYKPGRFI